MTRHTPAGWMRIGGHLLPPVYRAEILSDLVEERDAMCAQGRGRVATMMWMLGHLIRSAVASRLRRRTLPGGQTTLRRGGPGFGREIRQAARSLRKAPWYAATIIAVTALSMTLATTVFAIVDGVLFKPLPHPNPHELYAVSGRFADGESTSERIVELVSEKELAAWTAMMPDLALTGLGYTGARLNDDVFASGVTANRSFFDVFGVRTLIGGFQDEHYVSDSTVTRILISYRLWQEVFGGDPNIVGTVLPARVFFQLPIEIVGVLAPGGFVPPLPGRSPVAARQSNQIDFIAPLVLDPTMGERSMVAFIRVPGTELASTKARFERVVRAYRDAAPPPPANAQTRRGRMAYDDVEFLPLGDYTSARERPALGLAFATVMSLVCLVLLNAGALSAARAHQRIRELSLRRALGARTRDLLRHALAEQSLLVALGTTAGVVASPLLLAIVIERLPPGLTLIKEPRIDWRVMAFAGLVSVVSAFAVALLSISVATRRATLTPGSAGSQVATGRVRAGRFLLGAQAAVAFGLILGGALFATSLARIGGEDPGLDFRHLAVMDLGYDSLELFSSRGRARALELTYRLRDSPGVVDAAVLDKSIMENSRGEPSPFEPPDGVPADAPEPASVNVGSGFFQTTGIQLVSGRLPSDAELDTGAPVIVVSEAVARRYWPGRTAVGQVLHVKRRNISCSVVGVVRDVRMLALDIPSDGVIFVPWSLPIPHHEGTRLLVRLTDGPAALPAVTERIRQLDPRVRPLNVQMLEDAASDSIRERRLSALTASTFAVVALVFVAVGLLGLVAMTASRRTREVGIRMALGARQSGIVRQLVGEQLGAVVVGILAGGVLAAWAVRFIQAHLYDTAPYDPVVWATTVSVMLATATLGALIPAQRASRIDPVQALREE